MSSPPDRGTEVKSYKALPRDPNQKEHTKPRVFVHRPNEATEIAEEARQQATYAEALKTAKPEDFAKIAQQPCVRDAFLPGIGGGVGVGLLRFIAGGSVLASSNWASGCFVGISVVAYQVCQRRRAIEKEGIRKAVQVLDAKQAIKDAKERGTLPPAAASSAAAARQSDTGPAGPLGLTTYSADKRNVSFWNSFKFW